jgi:phage tail sheath protein FI
VTVFVGYTHPFKTKTFNKAIEIFNFNDYQANFGGYFDLDGWLPDYTGNAVNQFFQNGGADAWVVGIKATEFMDDTGTAAGTLSAAALVVDMSAVGAAAGSTTVTLTAREPGGVDPNNLKTGTPTTIQIINPRHSTPQVQDFDLADLIIIHGTTVETYRGLSAADMVNILGTADKPQSQLVTAEVTAGTTPASFTAVAAPGENLAYAAALPPPPATGAAGWTGTTLFNPAVDFQNVFESGASLDVDVKIFNIMLLPGVSPVNNEQSAVLSQALVFCEGKRAFFIMDAPPNATTTAVIQPTQDQLPFGTPAAVTMHDFWNGQAPPQAQPPVSANGAIYFPYLQVTNPANPTQTIYSPPSGFVAGIFAKEDLNYSVGKAPAGLETGLQGTSGVVDWGKMTDMQQGTLNKTDGVNCLREFPGLGPPVVFGARTLVADNPAYQQWMYVPVRRTALFLEQSLYGSLGWAVFQPNSQPLWDALTQEVEAFMMSLFRQGNYFQGATPTDAFLVQCDSNTTTQQDIDNGVVNILVGFAPLKPAEFVIIQITQLAGQAQT